MILYVTYTHADEVYKHIEWRGALHCSLHSYHCSLNLLHLNILTTYVSPYTSTPLPFSFLVFANYGVLL